MVQALEGVKVLDLCRGYPPATAAMHLADFGADVIKVDPVGFSPTEHIKDAAEDLMLVYTFLDRNKRSIKVNMRSEEGRDLIRKLAENVDVLIENSRAGTMERLGIGYETIRQINPRIIYCQVSGYGQTGPYRDCVGHDANFMAVSGALSLIGPVDGPPCFPSNMVADFAGAALYPLAGILLALLAREKTGKGQLIDISYMDAVFSFIAVDVSVNLASGEKRRRGKTMTTGGEPCSAVYPTKDGEYITLQCIEPQFWKNFCQDIEKQELISRQWPRNEEERNELFGILKLVFLTKTKDEWWEWAKEKQIMLAPVNYIEEAVNDPHLISRKMVMPKEHAVLGKIKQLGNPLKLSDTPPSYRTFCPRPGQHTDEILQELRFSEKQIEELRKARTVE